jgi:tetratricopeptide (TPR) repeat protein/transcriptional regulator with XRE-family HTH domain
MLRRYRLAAGLTQEELATRAGLSPAAISTLERGARRTPRRDTIALIADALQLTPAERALLLSAAGRSGAEITPQPAVSARRARDTAPPFVGRAHELTVIEEFLAGEGAPLLLVAGEPGIGKSRLLREAARHAGGHGWTVLEDGCTRRSGQEPYAPLVGALAAVIQRRNPAQLRADLQGCAWLARLLPELAGMAIGPVPQWPLAPDQERRLMFAAVERFLSNIGGAPGALLILDDLQWAGSDALDLLGALVRSSAATHVRLLGAYRSTEARQRSALRTLQSDLARESLAARLELGPVALEEGRALLASLLESAEPQQDAAAEDILRRTGGVPFFLVSCARGLRAGIATAAGAPDVPWDVGENIRQRVGALTEPAQELLAVAAVVGREIPGALLGEILAWPEADLVAALDTVCAARLLVEDGPGYRFAHDLIHEVVAADLSAAQRRALHARVAGAYERQRGGAPTEVLAYHYEQSGARVQAATYLELAGDNARSVFAYAECERYYRAALAIARALGDRAREAALCERLGDMLASLGRWREGRAAYEEALPAAQALGDREGVWRAMVRLTRMGRAIDVTPEAGLERLRPFLEIADQALIVEATPALVELYNARGMLQSDRRHDEEAVADHRRAAELAARLGSPALGAQSLWWEGRAYLRGGWRPEAATRAFEQSVPLFEAANDLPGLCDALNNIADFYLGCGELATMRPLIERAVSLAERIQSPPRLAVTVGTMSQLEFMTGRWPEARAGFERMAANGMVWEGACNIGALLLYCGAEAEGEAMLDDAVAHDLVQLGPVSRVRAERDLLEGRPDDALARFTSPPTHDARDWPIIVDGMPWLAWAYVALGEVERGVTALDERITTLPPGGLEVAEALYVKGMLELVQGRWSEARATLDDALARCRRAPYPYIEAKALYAYGRVEAAAGNSAQARARFEAALTILSSLGERMYASHIERALRDLR